MEDVNQDILEHHVQVQLNVIFLHLMKKEFVASTKDVQKRDTMDIVVQ